MANTITVELKLEELYHLICYHETNAANFQRLAHYMEHDPVESILMQKLSEKAAQRALELSALRPPEKELDET